MTHCCRILIFCVGMLICIPPPRALALGADDCAFWVWHRRDPLRADERQALNSMRASLLWHVGELDLANGSVLPHWRWRDTLPEAGALPVVRLNLISGEPFDQPGLVECLSSLADTCGRLQIDFDCPDRLLPKYARFLGDLRKRVPHLSATALAGWSLHPAFAALQENVESLDVMFYDLSPDVPHASSISPTPHPLLDEEILVRQLASWQACKIPWRAGLPNFNRITIFHPSGRSLGHIRSWTWEGVIFQPQLTFVSAGVPGLVLLKAQNDLVVAETPVQKGSYVAIRQVDGGTLARSSKAVKQSSARGAIFFRMPDSTDLSGWSLSQLRVWFEGRKENVSLRLRWSGDCLILQNESQADLPPRIASDSDRGYALEIDAPAKIWREALPGDFWRVAAHADPDKSPVSVPVPLCSRLTFWFVGLRAGKSLQSGLIQLAPGADIHQIRYRVLPGDQNWKSIE